MPQIRAVKVDAIPNARYVAGVAVVSAVMVVLHAQGALVHAQ